VCTITQRKRKDGKINQDVCAFMIEVVCASKSLADARRSVVEASIFRLQQTSQPAITHSITHKQAVRDLKTCVSVLQPQAKVHEKKKE
jgi:hypothetical protein